MRKPWCIDGDKQFVRVMTRSLDNHPGIEAQFDPDAATVTMTVPVTKLQLSKGQEELLLKLAGEHYRADEGLIKLQVSDFPLKEQNHKRAMEILRDLVAYVKVFSAYHSGILIPLG